LVDLFIKIYEPKTIQGGAVPAKDVKNSWASLRFPRPTFGESIRTSRPN